MDKSIRIDGGIGRVIAATGAIQAFCKKENELGNKVFVLTSFPQTLKNLEGIERIYPLQVVSDNKVIAPPFVYEDIIRKTIYLEPEPYNDFSYYSEEKHLAQVFNKLLNGVDEYIEPIMNFSEEEKESAKAFAEKIRKDSGKKLLLFQPWGSSGGKVIPCNDPNCKNHEEHLKILPDDSYRSFGVEFAKRLTDKLLEEYFVILVKNGDQAVLKGTQMLADSINGQTVPLDVRKLIALIPYVDGIVCCDSFLHHASAALGSPTKTIVLFAGTSAKNLGYPNQVNFSSWKKTEQEPNRIPHDHDYYVNKNKSSNEFKLELIDEILKTLKE